MISQVVGVVTGGASGLGAATAARLLRNGAKIAVCDLPHKKEDFDAVFARNSSKENVIFCPVDVTKEEDVTNALDGVESAFGQPLNTAVNCAGIGLARKTISAKPGSPPRVHSLEDFANVLSVNVVGSFNVARLAAERMCQTDGVENENGDGIRGTIINTASIAAFDGQVGQVAYAASKGAIASMTLPMARDLAEHRIRVMTIAPGLFLTPLLEGLPDKVKDELGATVPFPSRLGNPDEFAQLVESILTNPMLNGEVIRIDGALRMPPK